MLSCPQIFGAEWESASQATGDINLRFHPDQGQPVTANNVYSGSKTGEFITIDARPQCIVLLFAHGQQPPICLCFCLLGSTALQMYQIRPVLDVSNLLHHPKLPQGGTGSCWDAVSRRPHTDQGAVPITVRQ